MPSLTGHTMFENRPRGETAQLERVTDAQLLPVTVPVKAVLGGGRVGAMDLARLTEGEVILLDRDVDEPLRVFIGNAERFAATPGTSGRHLAFEVTGLIDADGFVVPFPERLAS